MNKLTLTLGRLNVEGRTFIPMAIAAVLLDFPGKMPVLNYTTTINSLKTVNEIQSILVEHGALNVSIDYAEKIPVAVTFLVDLNGELVSFRLPSNHTGVYKLLCEDEKVPNRLKTSEQARKVAWRIVKDWVEAQMAVIEAKVATLPQVFLPYAVSDRGQTLYELASEKGLKFLTGTAPS